MKVFRKDHSAEHGGEINLMPLIDVVFLLLIFFMLVSELSRVDVEQLVLPKAKTPEENKPQSERIIIVNVVPSPDARREEPPFEPEIRVQGERFTREGLTEFLRTEVAVEEPSGSGPGKPPSELRVRIRADKWVEADCIHDIYEACQRNGIYRVELASQLEDEE